MNKNLIPFFSLLIILISCSNAKNDLRKDNLFGKVKFVKEVQYYALEKFGVVEGDLVMHTWESKYDEKGNLTQLCSSDGERTEYNSDEKGNQIGITYNTASAVLPPLPVKGEKRNQIGITYNSKHNIKRKLVIKSDLNGNRIETNLFDGNNNLLSKDKNELDENGKVIKSKRYNSYGNLEEITEYKYDKNGNCTDKISTNNTGVIFQKYEEQRYDKLNNIMHSDWTIPSIGTFHNEYIYEFDKNNNWIKQITYIDQKPSYVDKREIQYWN
ncbi:MAG: RHS repeat protein [Mariniphaga sp.]|nr:RHS repeat protein [Mariniphaga sp.]